ncbi:MAG: hypothetical protein ACLQDC_12535, partial [Verrucomicrobiia bacterium]
MSVPLIDTAFVNGELSPKLFGRVDIAKWHTAASTLRNMFCGFTGGAYSRAGTAFVGFSKQTGRSYPPRLLPFQFSIQQGLTLEFGNFYMRVISEAAFVTDEIFSVNGITNANPAVATLIGSSQLGAASATVNTGGITSSYAPGDQVTLAGGNYQSPTVLGVPTTLLLSLANNNPGSGYVPTNTIHLTGGTQTTAVVLTVATTQVASARFNALGSPSAYGTYVMQGTTGAGTKFQASITYDEPTPGYVINSITGGAYTTNPTNLSAEPMVVVSGPGTWTGMTLTITMGVNSTTITNAGVFTANPAGATFTQASTSGSGSGATFNNALMGPAAALSVVSAGSYINYPSNPVSQASTTGTGAGATFNVTTTSVPGGVINPGDWLFFSGVGGMTQINGQTLVAASISGNNVTLHDVYGNNIDSTTWGAFTSGGTAARIYTLATPWAEVDLPWLKITQSADVVTVCCVNQQSGTEYVPYNLTRIADDEWTLSGVIPAESIGPPASASGTASTSGSVQYQYEMTAVAADGSESLPSPIATISSAVDIASTAGNIALTWGAVFNAVSYNIYKAQPAYDSTVPVGALFGFAGEAIGNQFNDGNIVADYAIVPPQHFNPFARGQIVNVNVISTTGTVTSVTIAINTSTGSGAVLIPVIISSALVAVIVTNPGSGYGPNDTATVTVVGGGSATVQLIIGPQTGTYPGVPAYFQERRVFANSLNNTDTYWMSQPGAFGNFDYRIPTIDSDAITGSPWSVEVNGIQFLLNLPQGLLVMTGFSVWLLVGAGSFATSVAPISPSSQTATPQPEWGCSPTVPPIKIDYDVLYLTAKSTIYVDLPYQLYTLSIPIDITEFSTHLFTGYSIREHAWCKEPYKLLWAVRNDGILLSLTWLKPEQVAGWARHDTNGLFLSVCSITEPTTEIALIPGQPMPTLDALYLAAQRYFGTNTAYVIERMDDRIWADIEDCWCVDCGFTLPQPTPNATLTASSATGLGACTGVTSVPTNSGWSAGTTATVVDAPLVPFGPLGPGTGAVPTLTIVAGVITAITFAGGNQGSGYLNPQLVFNDPAGSQGGSFASPNSINGIVILSNTMEFTASAAVFSLGNVGNVIRAGGGIAAITAYIDPEHVTANMLSPMVDLIPNSGGLPAPVTSGNWSMSAPVSSVYVPQLAGATVTGLADGNVIPPAVVPANGVLNLSTPASAVTIGFGFQAQLQSVYLDAGSPTVQGQRKKISHATARLEASSGVKMGSNQVDGSTLSPMQLAPLWTNL